MEDLASMITQFLGSEEGMNQLRAVTEAAVIFHAELRQMPL